MRELSQHLLGLHRLDPSLTGAQPQAHRGLLDHGEDVFGEFVVAPIDVGENGFDRVAHFAVGIPLSLRRRSPLLPYRRADVLFVCVTSSLFWLLQFCRFGSRHGSIERFRQLEPDQRRKREGRRA